MAGLDFRRDNDIESEHSYDDLYNYKIKYKRTPARLAFKHGLAPNVLDAIDAVLPEITVSGQSGYETGIPPIDVLIGSHGHANPLTNTAVIDRVNATEEVLHLIDKIKSGNAVPFTRFTGNQDYRDAVQKGTQRMSEAYTRPRFGARTMSMAHTIPGNRRMAQLLREDPDSPHYRLSSKFLDSHGKAYEVGNQLTDFPTFERRAAAMKESLPAILELPRDTAEKYYPEALELIDKWLNGIPY